MGKIIEFGKIDFANLIRSQDNGLSYPNMTECERYGMTWVVMKIAQYFKEKNVSYRKKMKDNLEVF